jgi:sulfate adenylyltransferase subunit 1
MLVPFENGVNVAQDVSLMVCWLSDKPLNTSAKYAVKHTSNDVRCMVKEVRYKVNINTLEKDFEDKTIGLNDIACINIRTTKPLFFDSYRKNRITGSLIIIDEATNVTVGAGMIL